MSDPKPINVNITLLPAIEMFAPRIDIQVYGLDYTSQNKVIYETIAEAKRRLDALAQRLLDERMAARERFEERNEP